MEERRRTIRPAISMTEGLKKAIRDYAYERALQMPQAYFRLLCLGLINSEPRNKMEEDEVRRMEIMFGLEEKKETATSDEEKVKIKDSIRNVLRKNKFGCSAKRISKEVSYPINVQRIGSICSKMGDVKKISRKSWVLV